MRAVLRPMTRSGKGTIVNVLTSATIGAPPKGFSAYAAAKHALRSLTMSVAAEYGARGIRAFSVSPGFMSTALTASWDARFQEASRARAAVSDPAAAGRRILELVDAETTAGQGEDYPV
jgi:NAD(P)-dependent dehydrogenase (short-subunit alcohol dehydrogenase family)